MEATNKYTIWTSETEAEYVWADDVVISKSHIGFIRNGKIVKQYLSNIFYRYNPHWKTLENFE